MSAFTERQKAYAHARSDRQVFTPQMIVNGKKSCIGSDRAQIEKAIQDTTEGRRTLPVDGQSQRAERHGDDRRRGDARRPRSAMAEIWVLPVLRAQTVPIGRGENRGKTITYANVVRGMNRLGEWRGGSARFECPLEIARRGGDGYVVLLQSLDAAKPGDHPGRREEPRPLSGPPARPRRVTSRRSPCSGSSSTSSRRGGACSARMAPMRRIAVNQPVRDAGPP